MIGEFISGIWWYDTDLVLFTMPSTVLDSLLLALSVSDVPNAM